VEAPKVSNRRVDLLGELPDGNRVHIELQSRNEEDFPLRMAEYLFGIRRKYGKLPRQVALNVGEAPMLQDDRIEGPDCSVRFHLVDIRSLDGEQLLASANKLLVRGCRRKPFYGVIALSLNRAENTGRFTGREFPPRHNCRELPRPRRQPLFRRTDATPATGRFPERS